MPKTPLESAIELGQECLKSSPVIVLGSGASVPFGLPSMSGLAQHLGKSDPKGVLNKQNSQAWQEFVDKLEKQDLENALAEADLNESLSDYVVRETWKLINAADLSFLDKSVGAPNVLPLGRLYRYLFSSTQRGMAVVTTNYDRLAEYAADFSGLSHYTGFTYGYLRRRQSGSPIYFSQGGRTARTVNIWKVHGCLDWFMDSDHQTIGLALAKSVPEGFRPAIVTPGVTKYAQTHLEPFRTIITGADNALMQANAYLCVGFGFNDDHIQPKLMERWQQGDALLVILTKGLTESVRDMLTRASGQTFLALEESPTGTQMWSDEYPDGELLDGVNWWQLGAFMAATT